MKIGIENDEQVVEFRGYPGPQEVFGKIKREEEPSVRSLLTWSNPEVLGKKSVQAKNAISWVSESHDAYKCFAVLSQLRPNTALEVKPIPEIEESAGEEVKSMKKKSPSSSPKPISKTPKGGEKASKRQEERIKKLKQTTRWLPNSAFKTYFGKPVFANYGQGNVNPAYGGLMYGDYMKTHNIAPHEGSNNPSTQQVYEIAETKALQKQVKAQTLPRKCKDEDRLPPDEVAKLKQRSQILAKEREKPSKKILKPDLTKEKLFKSEHNSAENSENEDVDKPAEKKIKPRARVSGPTEKKNKNPKDLAKPVVGKSSKASEKAIDLVKEPEIVPDQIKEEVGKLETNSVNAEVQVEDCNDCVVQNFGKLLRTSYQEMTSATVVDKKNQVIEPYKYCAKCRDCLYPDDVMRPPYSLGEIPPQELDPKNYKTLPPQWTQRIPAAGRLSYRSPSAYAVIFGENAPVPSYF